MRKTACILLALAPVFACSEGSPTGPAPGHSEAAETTGAAGIVHPPPRLLSPRGSGEPLAAGGWGGEEAELVVLRVGATSRFFCAHGTVDQPILLDSSGRFEAGGSYVFEGGPTPIDDTLFRQPAVYRGLVSSGTMALTVTLTKDGRLLGPFKLVFGSPTKLGGCPIV